MKSETGHGGLEYTRVEEERGAEDTSDHFSAVLLLSTTPRPKQHPSCRTRFHLRNLHVVRMPILPVLPLTNPNSVPTFTRLRIFYL